MPAAPSPSLALIRAARIALLLGAAGGLGVAVELTSASNSRVGERRYICPMHPEVISEVAGECPICHMALVPDGPRESTPKDDRGALGAEAPKAEPAGHSPRRSGIEVVQKRALPQELYAPAAIEGDGSVVVLLHGDEQLGLVADEPAAFVTARMNGGRWPVHTPADSTETWDRSTVKAHFHLADAGAGPPPGTVGSLVLAPRVREAVVVPEIALRQSADGPYVMVATGKGGAMVRRHVEVGRVVNMVAIVTSGLSAGERIATTNAFFADAEMRLQAPAESSSPSHR